MNELYTFRNINNLYQGDAKLFDMPSLTIRRTYVTII